MNRVGMDNFKGGHFLRFSRDILLPGHFPNFFAVSECHLQFFDPVASGPISPELAESSLPSPNSAAPKREAKRCVPRPVAQPFGDVAGIVRECLGGVARFPSAAILQRLATEAE